MIRSSSETLLPRDFLRSVCALNVLYLPCYFDVLLTMHLSIILVTDQLNVQILVYNKYIILLYMFRALLCSPSGGQNCIIQHLVSSHSVGGRPVHRTATYRVR